MKPDEPFALLTEKYLDGSLSSAERRELIEFLMAHRERQHDFAEQVRQHLRLTAHLRPCDRDEARKTAEIILDVIEKESAPAPRVRPPVIVEPTFPETLRAVWRGLRAPRDSGEYKFARFMLWRLLGPGPLAVGLSLLLVALLVHLVVEERSRPADEGITVILRDSPMIEPGAKTIIDTGLIDVPPDPTAPSEPTIDLAVTEPAAGSVAEDMPAPAPGEPVSDRPEPGVRLSPSFRTLIGIAPGRTEEGRQEALIRFKAPDGVEASVVKALRWLKARQRPDGSWEGTDRAAMTGLALLTFLAHGETPEKKEFGDTVERAIRYLLGVQRSDGAFSANVYAHAIAVSAIGEASALTRMMILNEALDRGLAVIFAGQQEAGGYDYQYARGTRSDTSVAGWQMQAMKAGLLAGHSDDRMAAAIRRGVDFLKHQAWAADGSGFVYASTPGRAAESGGTWSMTAVGTLCLTLLGEGSEGAWLRRGLKRLETGGPAWEGADSKKPVYSWYYATQAKFHAGGRDWADWNRHFARALMASQQADGHWEGGDHDAGTHVYTTTLSILMLEVYYRYLPSYAVSAPTATAARPAAGTNEVSVEIR